MGRNPLSRPLNEVIRFAQANEVKGLPRMAATLYAGDGWHPYVGFNSRKTHPLAKRFGRHEDAICLHAEIDAIRNCLRCGDDPEGGTMYVARVLKNGKPALAKPCEGCQRAIVAFGIRDVFWT